MPRHEARGVRRRGGFADRPLDPAVCLYPWPNDFFTVKSDATATGRRLNLSRLSMPANKDGVRIDPGRSEPRGRLQPRLDAHDEGSRPRHTRGG
jgi:hypothetical protein